MHVDKACSGDTVAGRRVTAAWGQRSTNTGRGSYRNIWLLEIIADMGRYEITAVQTYSFGANLLAERA